MAGSFRAPRYRNKLCLFFRAQLRDIFAISTVNGNAFMVGNITDDVIT